MAEPIFNDSFAFRPFGGGQGVRISVTTTASVPVGIPGTGGASESARIIRVRLVNTGALNACVLLGGTASRQSMVLLPGIIEMFTVPYSPNGVTLSAITESSATGSATSVSACAGEGF